MVLVTSSAQPLIRLWLRAETDNVLKIRTIIRIFEIRFFIFLRVLRFVLLLCFLADGFDLPYHFFPRFVQ